MKFNSSLVFQSLVDLFFPRTCLGCVSFLTPYEKGLCIGCQLQLSPTNFNLDANNPLAVKLREFIPIYAPTALFYFQKGGAFTHLIHLLKYKGVKKSGAYLGHWLALSLKESPLFRDLTGILVVPLHPKKRRQRGYNQSELIAVEISSVLNIKVYPKALVRIKNTLSQTKAGKVERWESMQNAFCCAPDFQNQKGHFLLVDDVITTGATLVSCAQALFKENTIKLSVAALGYRL